MRIFSFPARIMTPMTRRVAARYKAADRIESLWELGRWLEREGWKSSKGLGVGYESYGKKIGRALVEIIWAKDYGSRSVNVMILRAPKGVGVEEGRNLRIRHDDVTKITWNDLMRSVDEVTKRYRELARKTPKPSPKSYSFRGHEGRDAVRVWRGMIEKYIPSFLHKGYTTAELTDLLLSDDGLGFDLVGMTRREQGRALRKILEDMVKKGKAAKSPEGPQPRWWHPG